MSTRVLTGRGLRVPPLEQGASRLGGRRPAEGAAPSRVCVRRPRRGRARACESGMNLYNQIHIGKPYNHVYTKPHAKRA
eukprot:6175408-Pleurochrysis_carterae.AAC.2